MADYIKREDAIKAVANNYWHGTECECYAFAHKALDGIQSADVVPVVRCKDCRWWDKTDNGFGYCHAEKHCHISAHWEISIFRTYRGDHFCADGEREDDE